MIGLLVSCIAIFVTGSQSLSLSDNYPGFDGMNKDLLHCNSNMKTGTFSFDSGRGIAHYTLSDDMFYMEYYAPQIYWTGLSSTGIIIINPMHYFVFLIIFCIK